MNVTLILHTLTLLNDFKKIGRQRWDEPPLFFHSPPSLPHPNSYVRDRRFDGIKFVLHELRSLLRLKRFSFGGLPLLDATCMLRLRFTLVRIAPGKTALSFCKQRDGDLRPVPTLPSLLLRSQGVRPEPFPIGKK